MTFAAADEPAPVRRQDRVLSMPETPGSERDVRIDTSFFTTGGSDARPAVLLAHGFGGSKDDMTAEAQRLARDGYRVLTWSARGFGRSTGRIGLNAPDREVADVRRLIDSLGRRKDVLHDSAGDPRVGIAGASYGGAISLLAAGYDKRVDAVAPQITWWDLADSLFPGGVFKKLWAGVFFTTAGGQRGGCRFTAELCRVYEKAAVSGRSDEEAVKLLKRSSPSSVSGRLKVPTLVVQGQNDSLFPLDQGDAIARAVTANGAPAAVDWSSGGHDGGDQETARIEARTTQWFDRYLKKDRTADTGPAFRITRTGGVDTTDGSTVQRGADAGRYPGLDGTADRAVTLSGRPQKVSNPAGGAPPAVSAVPGTGALSQLSGLGGELSLTQDFPGQYASFESAPLTSALRMTGAARTRIAVSTDAKDGAVLFAKLYDVGPGGRTSLPHQLVAPLRVARTGSTATVELPAIDHEFATGHRLRLVLAATDLGYASPAAPATYRISLPDGAAKLTVPTDSALDTGQSGLPVWVWALPAAALALAAWLLLSGRPGRRHRDGEQESQSAELPLTVSGLSKRYSGSGDRYAVDDLCLRVERGQVLGLLGPNGAGKTTTMRMLMGLIQPDAGDDPGLRPRGPAGRAGALPGRRLRRGAGFPAAPDRPGQPRPVLACDRPPGRRRPDGRGAGDRRPRRGTGPPGAHVLPGHAAAPGHRAGHARPARPADPRRADQRARPAADPRDAGGGVAVRGGRPDRHRLQPSAVRGRAELHAPGRDGQGAADRRRSGRGDHRRRATPCSSGASAMSARRAGGGGRQTVGAAGRRVGRTVAGRRGRTARTPRRHARTRVADRTAAP